jgi:hypothetical protein
MNEVVKNVKVVRELRWESGEKISMLKAAKKGITGQIERRSVQKVANASRANVERR